MRFDFLQIFAVDGRQSLSSLGHHEGRACNRSNCIGNLLFACGTLRAVSIVQAFRQAFMQA